jgi:hypothetical protein
LKNYSILALILDKKRGKEEKINKKGFVPPKEYKK